MQPNDQQPTDENSTSPTEPVETPQTVTATNSDNTSPDQEPQAEAAASQPVPAAPSVVTSVVAPPPAASTPETSPAGAPSKARFSFLRTKKAKLIALVIAILIVLGGASAGAYFGIIAPAQPQRVIGDSLTNTFNSEKFKTSKFEGEITCVSGDSCKMFSAVVFKGAASDSGSFDANIQIKTAVTTIGLDARAVDKALYLRLSGLNGLDKLLAGTGAASEESAQYLQMVSKLNGNWYTIDESLLKQMGGSISFDSSDKLSKEDSQKIGQAYKNHQFIKVEKKLADENIHGQSSYHLQTKIDKDQLKAFSSEVKNANIKDFTIEQSNIDSLDKVDFSKYPFEIWVYKSNRMIGQLATTISEEGTTAKIRLALFDYNQAVTVEKPSGAKSVLELLSEFAPIYSNEVQGADSSNPFSLLGI